MIIVMYHYVRDLKNSRYPDIKGLPVELFREQVLYLKEHYTFVSMEDVLAGHMPADGVLLTFDDAYKDHFDFVFPFLDELKIPGAFFVPGRAISEHRLLDVNKIHFILASAEDKGKLADDVFALLDMHRREFRLKTNEEYSREFGVPNRYDPPEVNLVKRLLQKGLPEKLRGIICNELFGRYVYRDEAAFAQELYMSEDQLQCLRRNGMSVGSHGWNHVWLDSLAPTEQEDEVKKAVGFLQRAGCATADWVFCYPYGAHNESLRQLLKKYGCKVGLTVEARSVAEGDDLLILPRFDTNDLPKDRNAAFRPM